MKGMSGGGVVMVADVEGGRLIIAIRRDIVEIATVQDRARQIEDVPNGYSVTDLTSVYEAGKRVRRTRCIIHLAILNTAIRQQPRLLSNSMHLQEQEHDMPHTIPKTT